MKKVICPYFNAEKEKIMEKLVTNKLTIERSAIFDKNLKKRFELTFECKGVKEKKSILVIGLNPASNDISVLDTTTTFLLNNLIPMGYTTITICNLYAELFKERLKPSEVPNNTDNRKYLVEVLKRGFDTILLGYGNTFTSNRFVKEEKRYLKRLLYDFKDNVVDIVDDKDVYARLTATHPLMAGRYFSNHWKLRSFNFEEAEEKVKEEEMKEEVITEVITEEGEVKQDESNQNPDGQPVVSFEAAQ